MSFKVRKILATIPAIFNVTLAFLNSFDFGIFILALSVLMLARIVFRKFFARWSEQVLLNGEPFLVEVFSWVGLLILFFYVLITFNK